MSTQTQDVIVSGLPDLADAPFGSEIGIDAAEYERIMRRIGDGEAPQVSALNSSI